MSSTEAVEAAAAAPPPSAALLVGEKADEAQAAKLSTWRLAGITVAILGVQMFWSILMANGNPYLSSLGFSPTLSSLVWLAGPLSGTVVQPVVGMWSDAWQPKSRGFVASLGRRKPFIIAGAMTTFVALLALASVRETFEAVAALAGQPSASSKDAQSPGDDGTGDRPTGWLLKATAMFWVYLLNLAIQPLQVGVRAYVVDCVPLEQQVDASAWISRWNSFGAVVAFWLGSLDLTIALSALGSTQFQVLAVIDGIVLLATIPISFVAGKGLEKGGVRGPSQMDGGQGVLQVWRRLYRAWKVMPRTSWTVCKVQFWAWMAWFPFLYYNTMYIGALDQHRTTEQARQSRPAGPGMEMPVQAGAPRQMTHATDSESGISTSAAQAGSFASFLFALTSLAFTLLLPLLMRRLPAAIDVATLWLAAHVLFGLIMLSTIFVNSVATGTALVACLGFSWAMTQWAPYALISKEVSRLEHEAEEDHEAGFEGVSRATGGAGAILGIHNAAIAVPQIVAAVECAVLFAVFGALGIKDGIGWVLRLTAVAAFAAACMSKALSARRV